MLGQFLAILSGLGFAGASVFMRQAVFRTQETFTAVFVSILVGVVVFALIMLSSGEAGQLETASWQALAALAGAGIVMFILGRRLHYLALQLLGANRGSPLLNSSTIVAVILGITLMDEPFTLGLAAGVIVIVIGVVLISSERGSDGTLENVKSRADIVKGVTAGLSTGICYGCGPVLAKIAIDEGNSPFVALFVSYSVAFMIMLALHLHPDERRKMIGFYKKAAVPMSIGALSTLIAQLCRYLSLDLIPVSIVLPLNSTASLFTIPLSFIINRRIELFTWKIIVGAILVVTGVFLIFQV